MAVAATTGIVGGILATAPAQATPADTSALVELAQTYFAGENALRVDASSRDAAKAAGTAGALRVTDAFAKVRDDRMTAREQQRQLAARTGVHFSSVSTQVVPLGDVQRPESGTARLGVEERTAYTYAGGGAEPYSYRARHDLTFKRSDGQWRISGLVTNDPTGMSTPKKLSAAQMRAAVGISEKLEAGLRSTAEKRKAASESRVSGSQVKAPGGYNYAKMVEFALRYALTPRSELPYTPDDDDCTTFVSWALRTGGWEERSGWYRSDSAWWWKDWCDGEWYCRPQHSYTWGGATNWQRFAVNHSGRVKNLGNVWDVLLADVVQYDVKGYGGVGVPDHTMMVTAFDWNANGMPLLSYHSSPGGEKKNKPLIDILTSDSAQGQAFWAYRT
ncbi:amidase domain-containing protein [Streptomyces sp. NPDC046261]|uniref:amidase domain-containing protein n=1 Tax=Streptomyces sp. NPDC046261 TaxID=3157200 RepID=UPI0033C08748